VELDGVTKTAILLLSLEKRAAAKLLERLDPAQIKEVERAIPTISAISPELADAVLAEFHRAGDMKRQNGGPGIPRRDRAADSETPFSFLHDAEASHLFAIVQNEHPQTIALILSYLPRRSAATILGNLDSAMQVEVARRIAVLDTAHGAALREVEAALSPSMSGILTTPSRERAGTAAVAEMLNCCDRATERAVLDGLAPDDPELVEEIRRRMFAFEDICGVSDRGIQSLLKEIDHDELALALKTASEALKSKIFSNMSARARELIREEMEYMGAVRMTEVAAAQQRIVDVVRRLEESGDLVGGGRAAPDWRVA
jgi:flagellar motor switch protein FliG